MGFKNTWFNNPQWWFSQDYDNEITDKYEYLLDRPTDPTDPTEPPDPIHQILLYDQLPRHIFRDGPNNHIITYFLQKALSIKIDYDILDDNEYCFAMLPLRHTKDFQFILNNVLPRTWNRIYKNKNISPILRRFLKATYERCPLIGAKLDSRSILYYSPTILAHNPIINFKPILGPKNSTDKIVISLSGGVDSMVASHMLVQKYRNISAVHINYANRITSKEEAEANFVVDWCNTILHIPCYVRHITEINRQQCMEYGFRELYETYTRNVRYFAYKEFGPDAKIVLGHNKDDIMENIFTNIANKNKYDNLDGMTEYSTQDGICFWRPLLHLSKEEIIKYAHANNIPYLPNSTPTWSQRGQIRNSIVPVINKWNPQFISGLHDLSDTLNEYHEIMNTMIDEIICRKPLYIDKLHTSKIFWRSLFAKLGYENISNKSLNHMCERLSDFKDSMRINISKNLSINIKLIEKVYYLNLNKTI